MLPYVYVQNDLLNSPANIDELFTHIFWWWSPLIQITYMYIFHVTFFFFLFHDFFLFSLLNVKARESFASWVATVQTWRIVTPSALVPVGEEKTVAMPLLHHVHRANAEEPRKHLQDGRHLWITLSCRQPRKQPLPCCTIHDNFAVGVVLPLFTVPPGGVTASGGSHHRGETTFPLVSTSVHKHAHTQSNSWTVSSLPLGFGIAPGWSYGPSLVQAPVGELLLVGRLQDLEKQAKHSAVLVVLQSGFITELDQCMSMNLINSHCSFSPTVIEIAQMFAVFLYMTVCSFVVFSKAYI